MPRRSIALAYVFLALILTEYCLRTAAKMLISGQDVATAFHASANVVNFNMLLWQALPYIAWVFMAPFATRGYDVMRARVIFILGLLIIAGFYLLGFEDIEQAFAHGAWTGAALTEGVMPIYALVALIFTTLMLRSLKHLTKYVVKLKAPKPHA